MGPTGLLLANRTIRCVDCGEEATPWRHKVRVATGVRTCACPGWKDPPPFLTLVESYVLPNGKKWKLHLPFLPSIRE